MKDLFYTHIIPAITVYRPSLLKPLWKFIYQRSASFKFPFLNLGYYLTNTEIPVLDLHQDDEIFRPQIQLYHHIVTTIDIINKDVLEVGCGMGGGASFIMRYLGPKSVTAVDISKASIDYCNKEYSKINGLTFKQADAERLPFNQGSFDVVLNIESSHCYPSLQNFIQSVYKVLRPGGYFLHADMFLDANKLHGKNQRKISKISSRSYNSFKTLCKQSGFEIRQTEDITDNVLLSLGKRKLIKPLGIDYLKALTKNINLLLFLILGDWHAPKDTIIYNNLKERVIEFYMTLYQKPIVSYEDEKFG